MTQFRPAALAALASMLLVAPAWSVAPKYWIHDTATEWLEGEAERVSITSDGSLVLAPKLEVLAEPEVPYLWDVAAGDGQWFVGAGDGGWVLRVRGGKAEEYFECAALEVLSVETEPGGVVWAGTAPDGFVYRVDGPGEGEILVDLEESYVWDLRLGPDGKLYAAAGPGAVVYRIDPRSGDAERFVEIEDNHAVCLDFDADGRLLIGTEGRGLVVRADREGTPRVLHDCPQGEVSSVMAGADGVVWAAAAAPSDSREQASPDSNGDGTGLEQHDDIDYSFEFTPPGAGDGVLYRIDADGNAVRFWESGQGTIFDLAMTDEGDVLAVTGEEGAIFRVHDRGDATLVLDAEEDLVVAVVKDGDAFVAATANPARLLRLEDSPGSEGTYRSEVLDARYVSRWGRLEWEADGGGSVQAFVRRGNTDEPDGTWSDWRKLDGDGAIGGERARSLQWRLDLKGDERLRVRRVRASSLENNLAPILSSVDVIPAGNRFYDEIPEIRPRPLYQALPGGVKVQYQFDLGGEEDFPPETRAPWTQGMRQIRWEALDPNGDPLRYELFFRREDERDWKRFAEDVEGTNWTFNSRGVPDGEYRVRVIASDGETNPEDERSVDRQSEVFIVDNSSPTFADVEPRREGDRVRVTGVLLDEWSDVVRLESSVNGEDWEDHRPADGIFDSGHERLDVSVSAPAGRESSILLRGTDLAGNLGTTRVLIRP